MFEYFEYNIMNNEENLNVTFMKVLNHAVQA